MDQIPAVGNVLGFSLLLRDRRALLRLDHRVLSPGLTLRDYEAEIPGIRFPLQAPLSAGAFRHRRCRVCRATFELDQHAVTSWLERQLSGRTIAGIEMGATRLELCSRADPEGEPTPALHLQGRRPGGEQIDLLVALTLRPEHDRIRLRPLRTWLIGTVEVEADAVWQAVATTLGELETDDLVVDPGWQLLMPALVAAGWKAPDTSALKITSLELSDERLRITLSSTGQVSDGDCAIGLGHSSIDPVADRLQWVREALSERRLQDAVATLMSTAALLEHHAPARCALLRWVAALTRHAGASLTGAEELCLQALTQWLRTAPNDPQARRWLVELLARGDKRDELTRLSMAARELTRSPRARARFDLALGWLLSARPRDRAAARALLAPWIERADDDRQLADLRIPLRLAMAHARLDDPKRATATLERALEEISDASMRADARVELAAALIQSDQPGEVLPLLRSALRDDPKHARLADVAGEMAKRLGAEPATTRSPEPATAAMGRREQLLERATTGDTDVLPEIEMLLDEAGDDTVLREAAASLAREVGQPDRLARHLLRLRELAVDPRTQMRLRWERTAALVAAGQAQAVWAELAPALEHLADEQARQGGAWAVEYAPSSEVAPHVQRLLESSSPNEAIEVLQARWQRWGAPDRGAEALVELLLAQGQTEECRRLCRALADRTEDRLRVRWLVQAAEHAAPELAADLLEEALCEAPGDRSLETRLEAALQTAGQTHRLADLWRQRSEDDRRDLDERVEALDRRIALRHGGRNHDEQTPLGTDGGRPRCVDRELLELYRARIALRDDHVEARLALAEQANEQGDADEAEASMQRALDLIEDDDPRALEPALWLARRRLDASDGAAAAHWLQRVEPLGQQPHRIASMLLEAGRLLGDDEMISRALRAMLEATSDPTERAGLHLRLARLRQAMGDLPGAASEVAVASEYVDHGSPRHLEIAEVWLELARDRRMPPGDEARARAELRRALGDDLASSEIRHEALLWANALDDPTQAIELVEQVLARRPSDELLLSTLKEVCAARDEERRYLDALIRAIEHMPPQERRDALILELASGAVDLDEPQLALSTLDRLTTVGATSPEALDLRDWAVHQLGREDDELRSIDDKLAVAPEDAAALARLSRLEPSDAASAEHLVGLATRTPRLVASALVREALHRALRVDADTIATRALRRALELSAPGQPLDPDLGAAWDRLVDRALQAGDESTLAELLKAMSDFGDPAAPSRAQAALDRALAAGLHGPHCMRVLWTWAVAKDSDDPVANAGRRIDTAHRQRSVDWARQLASLAEQLDRRQAGALLRERAALSLDDPEISPILLTALQETGHLADVVRLLERGLGALDPPEFVATCKRLAHLYADHLGDPQRAEQLLEQALAHEPDDPDLLLPLLERYFERDDLGPAVDLSTRVLEHVQMGDAAYLALAHRAADAALAQGLQDEASELLRRALDRAPEDRRTLERVAELEAIQGDPEHRVRLLATVAERQGGRSRLEALEEQARLLVDPLGRHEQAIAVLEVLRREDPGRETRCCAGCTPELVDGETWPRCWRTRLPVSTESNVVERSGSWRWSTGIACSTCPDPNKHCGWPSIIWAKARATTTATWPSKCGTSWWVTSRRRGGTSIFRSISSEHSPRRSRDSPAPTRCTRSASSSWSSWRGSIEVLWTTSTRLAGSTNASNV